MPYPIDFADDGIVPDVLFDCVFERLHTFSVDGYASRSATRSLALRARGLACTSSSLGTIGFFVATIHYVVGSPTALAESFFGVSSGGSCVATPAGETCTSTPGGISAWSVPLALGLLGFWLVLLGMLGRRRRRPAQPATVEPAPA